MSSNTVTQRKTCRLCDSKEVKKGVGLNPVPLAEKYTRAPEISSLYPIDLYMCQECGHVQLLDVVQSEDLWSDYTYHSGQTRGIVDHFQSISEEVIKKYSPLQGSLVVDIGSNDGSLLRFFQKAGYQVKGVDPAKEIAAQATASGIETIPSIFTKTVAEEMRKKLGKASIVTAFNVFAHADNLGDMADGICGLLADDGIFVFEVQYLLDIVEKVLLGTIFHEHMSHHSLKPLIRFLDSHGMELIDVKRVTIQKGSLIGFVQKKGGKRKVELAVHDLLRLEKEHCLHQFESLYALNDRIDRNRALAKEWIDAWTKKGFTIAGYGAARSGPTLMMQFGFDRVIQYIFDDHPQKVNLFSPPYGIPVVPTKELCSRRPDVVIILAWIHARAIIEKSQDYLDKGGQFVICTPDLRLVTKDQPL